MQNYNTVWEMTPPPPSRPDLSAPISRRAGATRRRCSCCGSTAPTCTGPAAPAGGGRRCRRRRSGAGLPVWSCCGRPKPPTRYRPRDGTTPAVCSLLVVRPFSSAGIWLLAGVWALQCQTLCLFPLMLSAVFGGFVKTNSHLMYYIWFILFACH